ncbi:MAG: hypothetical protein ABSE84_24865 [Isosphaeraceae bacterium]
MFGNDRFEVVHFAFEFYGFKTYNVSPLSRRALGFDTPREFVAAG